MASLTGQSIASSYEQLLQVDRDGGGNTTTLVDVKDGDGGTTFALKLATDKIQVNGSIDLTGGQIKFPASQSASADGNTLDDYETGNWTPILAEYADIDDNMALHADSGGIYTKIGDMVTCSCYIQVTGADDADNAAMGVHGLPFTVKNVAGAKSGIAIGENYNLNLASGARLGGFAVGNTTIVILKELTNNSYSTLLRDEISTNAFFSFSITYTVA